MGAEWSASNQETLDQIGEGLDKATSEASVNSNGVQLFKFVPKKNDSGFEWSFISHHVVPRFYDENVDRPSQPKKWKLEIEAGDIDADVGHALSLLGNRSELRATFKIKDVWALKFPDVVSYTQFWNDYTNKLFENVFGDINTQENREQHLGHDFASKLFTGEAEADMDWEEDKGDHTDAPPSSSQKPAVSGEGSISLLKMGIGDNSYLVRGDRVDVLLNGEGGVEDKSLAFRVKKTGGSSVKPWKVMLADGENRMGMLSLEDRQALYYADIETGKVLQEWKFEKDETEIPMTNIVAETKSAPMEDRSTFLSFDTNRICRWDTRDPDGVVQEYLPKLDYLSGKDYARGTEFSCMATTGDGSVAVGSEDGKIRLYSNKLSLKKASTAFPGIGVPITNIDVSFDGRWVVATTDHFLEVIKTNATDEQGSPLNGFSKSISAHASTPKLLKLKLEDAVKMKHTPLKNGRFTFITEADHQERWIVATCGCYSVLWNFRQVKSAKMGHLSHGGMPTCMTYHLISKDTPVVDSCFLHEKHTGPGRQTDAALVVATPNKVWSFAES